MRTAGRIRVSCGRSTTPAAGAAEGVVHLAQIGLQAMASTRPEATRRARSQLVAHIDPLSGWARLADGELLPPDSLPALKTPGWRLRPQVDADLTRWDLGRTQRLPSLALRKLLGTVDGHRCRFPGCTAAVSCTPTVTGQHLDLGHAVAVVLRQSD